MSSWPFPPVAGIPRDETGAGSLRSVIVLALLAGLAAPGLVHAQGAVIEGTVTDATGLVLPGVAVEARGTQPDGPTGITVTDGAGAFAFSGLPPGTYRT